MIDAGNFSDIFTVRTKSGNKTLAVKQMKYRGSLLENTDIVNEMICLSRLDHTNVIKMHEILMNDQIVNIVMDYAENESLANYIASATSVEDETVHEVYSQILLGVQYCHHMDIAHNDLNPANILLTKELVVKIADFGLAVRCSDKDGSPLSCTEYLGNVSYQPPEVLLETPFYPKPVDIWSLGMILLYLVLHDIPYKGFQDDVIDMQLKEKWRDQMQQAGVKYSDRITSIVEQCLIINPQLRKSASDIKRQWDKTKLNDNS